MVKSCTRERWGSVVSYTIVGFVVRVARALPRGLADDRAVVLGLGVIAEPVHRPAAAKAMCALQRIGEDRLLEGAEGRALADTDTVDGALKRGVADADVGIAGGCRRRVRRRGARRAASRQVAFDLIEVETVIVARLVIGEGGVDGAQRDELLSSGLQSIRAEADQFLRVRRYSLFSVSSIPEAVKTPGAWSFGTRS